MTMTRRGSATRNIDRGGVRFKAAAATILAAAAAASGSSSSRTARGSRFVQAVTSSRPCDSYYSQRLVPVPTGRSSPSFTAAAAATTTTTPAAFMSLVHHSPFSKEKRRSLFRRCAVTPRRNCISTRNFLNSQNPSCLSLSAASDSSGGSSSRTMVNISNSERNQQRQDNKWQRFFSSFSVPNKMKDFLFNNRGRKRYYLIGLSLVLGIAALLLSPRAAAAAAAVSSTASTISAAASDQAVKIAADAARHTAAFPIAEAVASATTLPSSAPAPLTTLEALSTFRVMSSRAELTLAFRLAYAALGGAAVGFERSSSDRPAGVRTMALVSLGAAAFTICSMYGFLAVSAAHPDGPVKFDPSRLASGVASGVGFIGAGVITNNRQANGVYDRESSVKGLTTAAAIWVAAAVGVAAGVGLHFVAAAASLGTIGVLRFGKVKHTEWGQRVFSVGSKKKKKRTSTSSTGSSSGSKSSTASLSTTSGDMEGTTGAAATSAPSTSSGVATSDVESSMFALSSPTATATFVAGDQPSARVRRKSNTALGGGGDDFRAQQEEVEAKLDGGSVGGTPPPLPSTGSTQQKSETKKITDPLLEKFLWSVEEGENPTFASSSSSSSSTTSSLQQRQKENDEPYINGDDDKEQSKQITMAEDYVSELQRQILPDLEEKKGRKKEEKDKEKEEEILVRRKDSSSPTSSSRSKRGREAP